MSTREAHTEDRTPAPAGAMSRILGMEEASVIGLAPWMVEELDGGGRLAASYSQPKPSVPEASSQDLQVRHQREVDEAIQRTKNEAEARSQSKIQQEIEPWLRRMAQSIEDSTTVRQRYLVESEEQLVRLAVAIARRILHREIQVDGEALLGLVHAAIQRAELRELNRILLNPKDHQALAPHLERLNLPPRVQIVAESSLERGALLLESTTGVLDASIQSQLDEVERGFIDLLGKRR